jgi:hypothetical protein
LSSIMSILSSSYASAAQNQSVIPIGAKFAPVDPTKYQGTWTGKNPLGQAFSLTIGDVKGYRANVTFQSAGGLQYARVFITSNSSFRIGNSSFTLTKAGTAQLNTVVTDPTTGIQTVQTSTATLSTPAPAPAPASTPASPSTSKSTSITA